MNRTRMAVLVVATWAFGPAVHAQPTHPWEVVEITLEASREHTNAYVQGLPDRNAPLAQVTFTGTSGAARDMHYRLKVDLRPSQPTDRFEYAWFDLEQSRERSRGKVSGGVAAELHTPEDYPGNLLFKDWLLLIRRAER